MYLNIKSVNNQQPANERGGVAFANNQKNHKHEGWACIPGFNAEIGRSLPIPETNKWEEGLWIYTIRGRCQVINDDWKISGKWQDNRTVVFIDFRGSRGNPIDFTATIKSDGDLSFSRA